MLLWFSQSLAQDNSDPLTGPYRLPFAPTNLVDGCSLGVHAFIANNLTGDKGDWGFVLINLEEWRLEFGLRQRLQLGNTTTEIGAMLPIKIIWGGLLDAPLDIFHGALGISGNPAGEQYQVKLLTFVNDQNYTLSEPVYGFGDPQIWFSTTLTKNFLATLQLKFPLGNAKQLLGAGAMVAGGTISYTEKNWGAQLMLSLPYTNQSAMPGIGVQASWGARIWHKPDWLPQPWSRFGLELNLQTSPLVVPGVWGDWQIGLTIRFDDFGFSEDITRGLPDVVFDQPFYFGCPW